MNLAGLIEDTYRETSYAWGVTAERMTCPMAIADALVDAGIYPASEHGALEALADTVIRELAITHDGAVSADDVGRCMAEDLGVTA